METSSAIRRFTRWLLKERHSKCVNSSSESAIPSRKTLVPRQCVKNYQFVARIRIRNTYSVTAAFLLVTMTAASLLFLHSCNLVNSSSDDKGGVGIIVPGKSIDGIKLGDSKEKVVELLGEPDKISHALGFDRSWLGYHYLPPGEIEGSGFMVLFILDVNTPGPVDYMRAGKPYNGQTTEGIRIGSTVSEVLAAHGEPDYFSEVEWVNEFGEETSQSSIVYCIDSKSFSFSGRDGVVGGIVIAPYYPHEYDHDHFSCQ